MDDPVYFFKVNLLQGAYIPGDIPDENKSNILHQISGSTLIVGGVPYPLRHGDTFTLKGYWAKQAKYL